MIKRFFGLLAAALVMAGTVSAGDCLAGSDCANHCPLAQRANARLATGAEAVTVSKALRSDFARTVLANLDAI